MNVKLIDSKVAMRLVMENHYSQRKVGSKFSFGLFAEENNLVGCCVFSVPASYTLCKGVCGVEYRNKVLELSRLVITTKEKNAGSRLIGESIRQLGTYGDWVIVSYADCNDHVGHVGYVYQATNWIYTGQASAEPKWVHPETDEVISFTRRHIDQKAKAFGLTWKDLRQEKQVGKHRYCIFAGTKKFKREARNHLKYKQQDYPKGASTRHYIRKKTTLFSA